MTDLTVRRAEPADFAVIGRLTVSAYAADGQLAGGNGYERVLADVAPRAREGELLVAADGGTGQVLGSVLFVLPGTAYAELSGPGEAEFRMLAVDPAAQGRGVGATLVRACIRRATELGCRALVISTRSFALPAQQLYARLGFQRMPERDWSPMAGVDLFALRLELADRSAPLELVGQSAPTESGPIRSTSS